MNWMVSLALTNAKLKAVKAAEADQPSEYAPLVCLDDRYDIDGSGVYFGAEDFLDMCRGCVGEAPTLTERHDGTWVDATTGDVVLEPDPLA